MDLYSPSHCKKWKICGLALRYSQGIPEFDISGVQHLLEYSRVFGVGHAVNPYLFSNSFAFASAGAMTALLIKASKSIVSLYS